jgi:hypothetical protein
MLSKKSKRPGTFRRPVLDRVVSRLREPRRFIQVLSGPRQCGKTTLAHQAVEALHLETHYASADAPTLRDAVWIEQQWEIARRRAGERGRRGTGLLVLDEVQKVPAWSRAVKGLWDADTRLGSRLRVLLLGSSPLLMQRGLTESLAGRFEVIPATHWSYSEMRAAFGWSLDQYVYYGGYPGSAPLVADPQRWAAYIRDALIETTISRDILLLTRVDKPALLRRLFQLGSEMSGRILSFQKMTGQLQDAGNTTTLAHYLELLEGAGFIAGVQKFSERAVRTRGSSPKLIALNTALVSALAGLTYEQARSDPVHWGRLVESAVGAHLVNGARVGGYEVFYWLDRNHEVDFVIRRGKLVAGFEVKSGRNRGTLPGVEAFRRAHPRCRPLLLGEGGIPLAEFLGRAPERWLKP